MRRCDYCDEPSTVRIATWQRPWGRCRMIRVVFQTCAQHEGCLNWTSIRQLHSDIPLDRYDETRGRWVEETAPR